MKVTSADPPESVSLAELAEACNEVLRWDVTASELAPMLHARPDGRVAGAEAQRFIRYWRSAQAAFTAALTLIPK